MIKHHPPLPFVANPATYKAIVNPDDPTSLEILTDLCWSFDLLTEHITTKSQDEFNVKYRRLYCYLVNVLSSESSDRKASLVNISRGTYLFHAKKCVKWFEANDEKFINLWTRYLANTKLWHKYFTIKQKEHANCIEN